MTTAMGRSRILVAALILAVSAVFPVPAASGEHGPSAGQLGQEAVKLYEAGDYAGALEKLDAAYQLFPSPTLGLYSARCLVKLNRLVEASDRYLEVTRLELNRNAPKGVRKAQADAGEERDKLLPRIPSLEILLEGARGSGVDVTVDHKPLHWVLLGEKRRVNPGRYRIEAKRADATVTKEVSLGAGESARVVLELPPLPMPRMPARRVAGWAAIGVAGAGAVTGSVAGIVAIAEGQSLAKSCANGACASAADPARTRSYDAARAASAAGFVACGLALAAGIPLLVLSPKVEYAYPDGRPAPPPPSISLQPWLGPASAGVRGTF
jgi:hypothetical protein